MGGDLHGRPVTLAPALGTISGSGIDLVVERHGAGTWITGTVFDAPVKFEVSISRVKGFAGGNAFDLALGLGQYDGPSGMLTLRGAAGTNAGPCRRWRWRSWPRLFADAAALRRDGESDGQVPLDDGDSGIHPQ